MTEFEQTPIEKETEADARAEAKAWAGAATQPVEAAGPLSGEIIANAARPVGRHLAPPQAQQAGRWWAWASSSSF